MLSGPSPENPVSLLLMEQINGETDESDPETCQSPGHQDWTKVMAHFPVLEGHPCPELSRDGCPGVLF